ncbi:hypothetical protein ADU37_CDS19800 [Thermococcus sp. 2319x1]|nr:hypothetical protein ADU37_CDS19800 [Thermococcus sp. 2319x1]
MMEPKDVIRKIREELFGIGIDSSGLPENVKNYIRRNDEFKRDAAKLAEDIHTKKPHFIFELIQNAEDNEYEKDVIPKIKFVLTSDYLIIQNNETGFKEENVWALCKIGGSTKTNKSLGYIGEKGIGFKSVFMVANEVQIFSNSFQFRFKYDKKDPLTMLIPEWIEQVPDFVDLTQTNIILVLNDESKAEAPKYLDDIHPNLLLFLRKLRIIEIEDQTRGIYRRFERFEKDNVVEIKIVEKVGKLNKISILRWFVVKKLLTVPPEISEDKRKGVKETEIILAFPLKEDGSPDDSKEQHVFAFLPVRKYGFKFIIQADFILSITREDIKEDNMWNLWLRNSIIDVFMDAVREFKKDEKLKYSFYEYLPLNEVKDEFFLPIVDGIYKRLKDEECVLTEANTWKKPSEVLIGDKEIKRIVTNEDLQKFFGREYVSNKIKAKKEILRRLGVEDFSIDYLIRCLENTEWLKKQSDEWFVFLFKYLSNKNLSKEQLENLRSLNIIRLENGGLTSINKGIVFFPIEKEIEKEKTYGFESELRIIKRGIINTILKYKEERGKIFEFLEKLGVRHATPYEIIESHILPVYENGMWRGKDPDILTGYVMFIKYHLNEYYEESDRRLNGNRKWLESKKDPLERLKKSLLIRTNRNSYDHPENIYLPKSYGNENDLERLFEGLNVSFVHPCYLEQDIKHINDEIAELENKLKDKSKTWKKKHRKEVKKIEKRIKELEEKRKEKIREWKEFFLKIGIHEVPRVEDYEGSCGLVGNPHTRCAFQMEHGIPEEEMEYSTRGHTIRDWMLSPEFRSVLEKENAENMKILLAILDKYWDKEYSKYLNMSYYWFYYYEHHKTVPSSFIRELKERIKLPTIQNTLARPSEVFLDKPEIRELLGDTVPYLAVEIKNEELIKALGINTRANVRGVLNYLKALVEQGDTDKEKFEKLYEFLDKHFEEDATNIRKEFSENPLIFVPNAEKKYYSTKEVIWRDVSNIFGKNRIYLERYYPKLKKLFVEKLGISERPTPKDYANVLLSISRKIELSDEDKKTIVKIYEELNRNLNPDKVENPISQEDWWKNFIQEAIFLTDKGEFRRNLGDIFINDDNELYELFKDEENIHFLWLPKDYHIDKIKFFIGACGLRYISKSTKVEPLLEEGKYSKDYELTDRIRAIIPYVLRYLYWRENAIYEKLKKEGVFEKIRTIKVYAVETLKVKYSTGISGGETIDKVTERKCIYHDGNLYIERNNASLNDLAVEFSKVFGEVKGLDSFLLLIINTSEISEIEEIIKIQKIGKLPENDAEFLRNVLNTEKIEEKKEELLSEKKPEKTFSKEEGEGSEETPPSISTEITSQLLTEPTGGESVIESNKGIPDKTREKEWTPEFSPEEVPVMVEEYDVQKQSQLKEEGEEHNKKSSMEEIHLLSPLGTTASPAETLSRKTREDIGRWGEEYALRCIKYELMEKYPDAIVVDTEQGFRLERDGNVVMEVIWENKKCESGKPYDIKIIEEEREIFVEVKATPSATKGTFQLSENEWSFMKEKGDRYCIYRVYRAGSGNPKVTKIQNPIKLIYKGKIKVKNATIEI